jgi:DNA-binding PadR family transcriptional regulator
MAELTGIQRAVLEGLQDALRFERIPASAAEVRAHLSGQWSTGQVYDTLSRLSRKGIVRRVGWSDSGRTWTVNDA